jgi:PAS domain S-box-containing protein
MDATERRPARRLASRGWPLRTRLAWLVGLTVLPLAAYVGWDLDRQRQEAYAAARADAARQVHQVAMVYHQVFKRGQDLAALVAALPAVRREDWPEVSRTLASLAHRFPEFPNIRVSGPDGEMRASAMPDAPATSNAGRDWFEAVLRTGHYAMSTPFVGVTTGRLVTVLGYPVRRHREPPQGVVSVTIEVAHLAALASEAVTPGFAVTLVDPQGHVLSRVPAPREGPAGGWAADPALIEELRSGPPGAVLETGLLDGVPSVVAYERIPLGAGGPPVTVAVSRPRHQVIAPVVERMTVVALGGVLIVALVSMGGGLGARTLIGEPVKALIGVQRRIANGDLGAKAPEALLRDSSEFGQLARTLADLGGRLQEHEARRAAAEARLRAILDAYPGVAALVSSDLRVEEINTTLLAQLGLVREQIIGRHLADLEWEQQDDATRALSLVRRALSGDAVHEETTATLPGAGRRTLDVQLTPIGGDSGAVTQVAVFGLDVTAIRSAEDAARENAAQMTLVFNTSSDLQMLFLADDAFTIVAANAAFRRMAGRVLPTAPDPVGLPRSAYLRALGLLPEHVAAHDAAFRAARDQGTTITYPVDFEHPALGRRYHLEATITAHRAPAGHVTHVLWSARDVSERTRAERALRASEERLQEAQRLAHLGSWEVDLVTGERLWSDGVYRIFEIEPSGAPPTHAQFLAVVHPDDRAPVDASFEAALRERRPYVITHRLLMPDGRVKFVEQRAEFVVADEGTPLRALGTTQDISERVLAAEALRQSEARLLRAQRIARIGDWSLDLRSGRITWSQEVYRIFEVAPEDFTPTYEAFLSAIHPQDRDGVDRAFRRSVEARRPYRILHRLLTAGGRVKIVEEQGETTYGPDGTPVSARGTVQDVTERMEAAAALREREANLRQAELLAGLGHYRCHEDGSGLVCSDGLKTLLGLDLASTPAFDELLALVHPDDRAAYADRRGVAWTCDEPFDATFRIIRRDGVERTLQAHGEFQSRADGHRTFVCTAVDVTAIKEAERRLAELNETLEQRVAQRTRDLESSNRELESFSYSVSHDLRAPLRAIDGFTQAAIEAEAPRLSSDGLALLRRVQAAAQRMGTLIDALLRLSQMYREPLRAVPVDLTALARSIAEDLVQANPARQPEVVVADGLTTVGDPRQLRVALTNLLDNAFKFSARASRPRVEVGARQLGGREVFFVRDNGVGFDMDRVGKLFQPFERLHSPLEYPGTGIGLATVQRVAQRHGGSVWAESAPGRGATFYLVLDAPADDWSPAA